MIHCRLTSMKLLALVLLLSAFSSLTLTEVVQDFSKSKCSEFFIKKPNTNKIIEPNFSIRDEYKKICQYWKGAHRYATLYDTKNRIPVYSAYTFTYTPPVIGDVQTKRNDEWKNEPQLESSSYTADMKEILESDMDEYYHQAVNRDYSGSQQNTNPKIKYTRGHVFPRRYAADQDQEDSTFTFTNIAPQTDSSQIKWGEAEKRIETDIGQMCNAKKNKNNHIYVVTGVVPGKRWISIKRKVKDKKEENIDKGVNIPSYYWAAFCCVNNDKIISKAYLSLQNLIVDKDYELTEMSVNILNKRLTELYNQDLKSFKDLKIFGDFCET